VSVEIDGLLDKAAPGIHSAQLLLQAGEADFAAGRAYYAMFYTAEALLRQKGLEFHKHSAVHAAYGLHFAKTRLLDPKFHVWLLNAFDRRLEGDYDIEPSMPPDVVSKVIERAQEFLNAAKQFLSSHDSSGM
jgi:uncharacterized protein (UPF0332 family)